MFIFYMYDSDFSHLRAGYKDVMESLAESPLHPGEYLIYEAM